jgi:hypothetical protein
VVIPLALRIYRKFQVEMQFLITADKLAGTNLFVSVFSYSDKVIYLDIKKLLAPNMRKEF